MLGSASLLGVRKSAIASSLARSKRCVAIKASVTDPAAAATVSRSTNNQRLRIGPVATGLSLIAAQLIAANAAFAEVPEQALISLQAAEPLTELSETTSTPAAVESAPSVEDSAGFTISAIVPTAEVAAAPTILEASAVEDPTSAVADLASAIPELAASDVAEVSGVPAEVQVDAFVAVDVPAEPAVASPVINMDIPAMPAINADTNIKTLVAALIQNEQFIAALVNNEAFLDRLAGEDRVVEELAKRKGLSVEVEARGELATELRRRQQVLGALAARGEEAVLAVADAAKKAAEEAERAVRSETREADVTGEVGVISSGKSALVAMETAVELLEDSQELLQAVELNPGATPLSTLMNNDRQLQREFEKMEAAVARAEQSVSRTLENNASEPLPVIQDAVRELYSGESKDVTIGRAYSDLVTAVAEMQRAYGSAISKAVGHAVAEVTEVEEAAVQGAEKTKKLMSQKVVEVERVVGYNPATFKQADIMDNADETVGVSAETATTASLRIAVVGAFLFWVWGTFVQPRLPYGR